jgi:hypothetical protein
VFQEHQVFESSQKRWTHEPIIDIRTININQLSFHIVAMMNNRSSF